MIFDKYYRCKICKQKVCKTSDKTDLKLFQHLSFAHPALLEESKHKFISTICNENFYVGGRNGS